MHIQNVKNVKNLKKKVAQMINNATDVIPEEDLNSVFNDVRKAIQKSKRDVERYQSTTMQTTDAQNVSNNNFRVNKFSIKGGD